MAANKKSRVASQWRLFGTGMLYLLPALIFFGVFLFYPIAKSFYYSFFTVSGGGGTEGFVGLAHYKKMLTSPEFYKSMKSTFIFALYIVPGQILVALFFAIISSEKLKGIGIFRTIFSATLGVSTAAGATIFLFMLDSSIGSVNQVLEFIGFEKVDWLSRPNLAMLALSVTTIWMQIGINYIILLAGIQNVDKEMYESAKMDGAGYFSRLFKITIPLISPVLFFVLIIAVIGSFQTFGQIDLLTGGGPNNATNLIVYEIYQQAFTYGHFGYASAQAFILFLIILVITLIQFRVGERKVHYQ